ncbi:asparagine synthase (glutamine-hydrolyzing) [Schlesneria sp. DSM 10557]|uniref:asparagine synthase (glutamine-hydrolyzing) n=1 Tax=Schlesneria sp. DSM 10557 TaxID=3044399 RepID=UPI0035A0BE43
MCGIAGGSWTQGAAPLSEQTLHRMTEALIHRGPDDAGVYFASSNGTQGGGAALGFRRLSIIDLSGGHQPMSNEDETVWIAFNGEVYNYRELKPQLEALGHRFRTSSDTECIVHAYEQWGRDCVSHLRGMFAFAIWDDRRRTLFLARDRMGQKPLVYRLAGGQFTFASELKALMRVPGATREIDPRAVADFVTLQYVPHPRSIFRGYAKLSPAHWAEFHADTGELTVQRYWEAPFARPESAAAASSVRERSREEWAADLRETLREAVRIRMRCDVPFGAFLSGGVDSTIIAGLMQQHVDRPIQTFSIGFSEKRFDERSYAREAAAHLGTEHHEFVVDPTSVEMLPKLTWHYDEPFADSSAIPTLYLSQLTRKQVTVALTGDGSDELFAGYDRYQAVDLAARVDSLPAALRSLIASSFWQKVPTSGQQKSRLRHLKRFLAGLSQTAQRRYTNWISIFDDSRRAELFSQDFRETLGGYDGASFILESYARCSESDMVQRTCCVDAETYLPCDILTKVDIASMAFSLECRSPFLDHRVVELAARMPRKWKLQGRRGKQILISTFSELLPASIQTRRKMGFGVPLDYWFRNSLREYLTETLLDPRCLNRGYFDPAAVRRLLEEHMSGKWDHSPRLWLLLVFELWHQRFVDSRE